MLPAYLANYPDLKEWKRRQPTLAYRRWVLDSGAWSAFNAGVVIELERYIDDCLALRAGPEPPHEIFALDVIGDHKASLKNALRMKARGVVAIPTYHFGEPIGALKELAAAFPKIAIGGVAHLLPAFKLRFAEQCMSTVWPKKVHGFSYCERSYVLRLPWDSVDSTAWIMQPVVYARWRLGATGRKVRLDVKNARKRGDTPIATLLNVKNEIDHFLKMEGHARARWGAQLAGIGSDGPTLYLAIGAFENPVGYERRGE